MVLMSKTKFMYLLGGLGSLYLILVIKPLTRLVWYLLPLGSGIDDAFAGIVLLVILVALFVRWWSSIGEGKL